MSGGILYFGRKMHPRHCPQLRRLCECERSESMFEVQRRVCFGIRLQATRHLPENRFFSLLRRYDPKWQCILLQLMSTTLLSHISVQSDPKERLLGIRPVAQLSQDKAKRELPIHVKRLLQRMCVQVLPQGQYMFPNHSS